MSTTTWARAQRARAGLLTVSVLGLLASACDARVPASEAAGATAARPAGDGRAYESCAASHDCTDGLRCLDGVCRSTSRSALGDLHAASGAAALRRGGADAAIAAYAEAIARYDADGIVAPAELDCGYGEALLALKDKPERAELAAKVLHRCMLATPPGSRQRESALAGLADLLPLGLDPAQVAKPTPADLYLTRPSAAPPASAGPVAIAITLDPPPPARTEQVLTARLAKDDVDAALRACWTTWAGVTKQRALTVPLPVRGKALPRDYDEDPVRYALIVEPIVSTSSPDGVVTTCVRTAIEGFTKKGLDLRDAVTGRLVVAFQ
jgi:hypothetical protein